MTFKAYDALPQEAKIIRTSVFIEEQGFVEEFDSIDEYAVHIVAFDGDAPAGTVRIFKDNGNNDNYFLGRLAVLKAYRGTGLGAKLVAEAERVAESRGAKQISLHSQVQAKGFYAKQGYTEFGEQDFDEDCPHQWMKKSL